MDVLIIIFGVILVIAVPLSIKHGINKLNEHTQQKFGYQMLNIWCYTAFFVAAPAIYFGWSLYNNIGNEDNGIVLIAIGSIIAIGTYIFHIKKTNALYGVAVTTIGFLLSAVFLYLGFILFIFLTFITFFGALSAKPVYIVNK